MQRSVAGLFCFVREKYGKSPWLTIDRALRRICGLAPYARLPSAATFSRAFGEFAKARLGERAHEALIRDQLGGCLIGHISRDGTAIAARERPARKPARQPATTSTPEKKGRQRPGRIGEPTTGSPIRGQLAQTLPQMLAELPTACARGTKCNAQGYKTSWNGYKLHVDTADCGVPVAAVFMEIGLTN